MRIHGPPGKDRRTARVLGLDGPGWILRCFVTGVGAEPGSTEEWPCTTFQGTVVRLPSACLPPAFRPLGHRPLIRLRWPGPGV